MASCAHAKGLGCPEIGQRSQVLRSGLEDFSVRREMRDGTCYLIPVHPDGTEGVPLKCLEETNKWDIGKLYMRTLTR